LLLLLGYLLAALQPRPNSKDGSNNEPTQAGTPQGSSKGGTNSEFTMKRRQPTASNLAGLAGDDTESDAPMKK